MHTTNHQLQYKIHELEGMTDDLNNLLAGSRIATVFLDDERRMLADRRLVSAGS